MNLDTIRPKFETEDFLLWNFKNYEFIIQTHRKAEERLEFKLKRQRENFSFKSSLSLEGSWMIGLKSLEVWKSIFIITEGNNKFEVIQIIAMSFQLKN